MKDGTRYRLVFRACELQRPDGKSLDGWELWVDGRSFGKAIDKETLKQYYERIKNPPPLSSFHWKNVHKKRRERQQIQLLY